jgi:ribonuclease III
MYHTLKGNCVESPTALVKRLELPFNNLLLLTRALTHRSYVNEHDQALEDNERLEFLGDAVLDFIAGAWLYSHYPEMAEGDLTRMRSVLVCTEQLAEFARILDLGSAIRLGRGEDLAGGRQKDVLLCNTFESLTGALFLECGITVVQNFIHPMFERAGERLYLSADTRDPKSRLQEWSQGQKIGIPNYVTISVSGPDHNRVFEVEVRINGKVLAHGIGSSKQLAERAAAQTAIDNLEFHQSVNE